MTHTLLRSTLMAGAALGLLAATPVLAADRDDGYPVPQPPQAQEGTRSYKDDPAPPPPPRHRVSECLSKYGIRHALNEQGWHEFDAVEMRGNTTFMTASHETGGRRFEVRFDSCTGDVIDAHPRVVYVESPPPPIYYSGPRYYYEPRPAIGFYFGGGGRHRW